MAAYRGGICLFRRQNGAARRKAIASGALLAHKGAMTQPSAYSRLESLFARLSHLDQATGFLHWDMSAVMPEGGAKSRGEQLATMKSLSHEMLTAPQTAEWLDAAEAEPLDDWQRANLREMRRDWLHASCLPTKLVETVSKACSACEMSWRQARPAADFAQVKEALGEVVALTRETAAIKSQALALSPYDALLDQYEPGARSAEIALLFDDLAAFLPGFLQEVAARQRPAPPLPQGPFALAAQKEMGVEMMTLLGFDFRHGRLDESLHPFCGGTPDDVRITTRYDEQSFLPSLFGVIHETGHALYEQGLPADWRHQPVGRARGMSLHESQSLLMEMQACRSRGFFHFLTPRLAARFGQGGWDADRLYDASMRVEPDFIRVDADEVTYPAHVILRFNLERALIKGELAVADLPAAWNEGMERLLGITPPDDRRGCLQDIHWFDGAFGYFPTYSLGAMTAAQLFDAARRDLPGLEDEISAGRFAWLLSWLRNKVHGQASLHDSADLLRQATGRPLDAGVFKAHLRRRYLSQGA
jgi:carboxypeptidase Taq